MIYKKNILTSASEERLEKLIKARLQDGADKEQIDKHIWDLFGEEWCIMATDLSGFSRHVAKFGIIHFLQTVSESERLLSPIIEEHDGILLKVEGDSFLVIFRNPNKAVDCAVHMQTVLKEYNLSKIDEEKVLLCVGLGFGRVLKIGDHDVFGQEVNAASKLGEDNATSGEILVTESLYEKCKTVDGVSFEKTTIQVAGTTSVYKVVY
jgi:class 3 adenylate cyclase